MQDYKFYLLLFDNWELFIISILISAFPIYFIAKKYSQSWIDPLRINLIFVVFSNSVPLFLYFIDEISTYLFSYFLFAEILFWIGFSIAAKRKINFSKIKLINETNTSKIVFFIFFSLYILFTIVTYAEFGFPIFLESRLTTYFNSGGLGVLGRLNSFFSLYILMYSYYQIDKGCSFFYKLTSVLVFVVLAITGILSGSRASFFIFLYSYFGYQFLYKGVKPNFKKFVKYFPVAVIGAIIVLLLTSKGNLSDAFILLAQRVIASGDCYWQAYPNEIINNMDIKNSMSYLFSGILGPLRLIDYSTVSPPIGAQLTWNLFPYLEGVMVGPNARPPILGYVLFGRMGLLFSLMLGIFTSGVMFRLAAFLPKGFIPSVFVMYLYLNMLAFIVDPVYGFTCLFDVLLNFSFLLVTIFSSLFLIKVAQMAIVEIVPKNWTET